MELVALTGRVASGVTPTISTSYSLDGLTFTPQASINAANENETLKDKLNTFSKQLQEHQLSQIKPTSTTPKKSSLSQEDRNKYTELILNHMEKEKPYLKYQKACV